ncbi:amidohydrolase [Ureibacillus manganicus DSM 26584]|uniref:Amidohydrolase n=1 Tax=Ureibacillus manganicus DSM 26584 TaxID=1384049 RepID=A0A0A3HZP0_9BACL|nr:M20 family metallopeptidase [Ureibacillus manganicus]KGR78066.1 amidohydrolase [Ureibacillus manganicus DSM 26584]
MKTIDLITKKEQEFISLSKKIWFHPELRFQEHYSSKVQQDFLEENGFTITNNLADIPTAFKASFGNGSPIIGILGEFDALSNLSQKESISYKEPHPDMENGHGCGHNLLGVGGIVSAITLKNYLEENRISGTIIYYGCPAEEGGSGKTFMQRAGVFNELDLALTWHPSSINGIMSKPSLANIQASFKFRGTSSHAAISPHLGRSALDAVELMNVGANYLREHVTSNARIHYAYLNTGGTSPNIVQSEAEILYLVRAPQMKECKEIFERVKRIATGATYMTDTTVELNFQKACSNFLPNRALEKLLHQSLEKVGAPIPSEEETKFATEIWNSLTEEQKDNAHITNQSFGFEGNEDEFNEKPICDFISPYSGGGNDIMFGSTDVGDVSWTVPTAQLTTACFANGTPFHSWQMVSQSNSTFAFKGMISAGAVMADTAIKIFQDPELLKPIQEEFKNHISKYPYQNPIPKEVKPYF